MSTSFDQHADLAYSTVAASPSPSGSGTQLTVAQGTGWRFGTTAPFWVLSWPQSVIATATNAKLLRVTAIAGDTMTLDRSQDKLSARQPQTGDQVMAPLTADAIRLIEEAVNALESNVATLQTQVSGLPTQLVNVGGGLPSTSFSVNLDGGSPYGD